MGVRRSQRFRARRGTLGALALTGLLAACQTAPTIAPGTGQPGLATVAPSGGIAVAGTEAPGASPPPTSAHDLIESALASGTIDAPTALLDRVYAFVGDPRLPTAFASGAWTPDDAALLEAGASLDSLPSAIHDELLRFTLRPTDADSPWNGGPLAAAGTEVRAAASHAELASVRLASAAVCRADGWAVAVGKAPFNVWVRCGQVGETNAEGVAQLLDGLWGDMTGLMGAPIPDQDIEGTVGDGRIDIYLTNGCVTRGGACTRISATAVAVAQRAAPFIGSGESRKSSGFVILTANPNIGFDELRHDLAHEFFHVLEFAHNAYAPFAPSGWFGEASSTWAESYFTQEEAAGDTNLWFGEFQDTGISLQKAVGDNVYASFMWPFFMQQEGSPSSIADAWVGLEGKETPRDMMQAISAVLPFETRFRDFAVRDFNQTLDPGNPIPVRFSDQDKAVSSATPGAVHVRPKIELLPDQDKNLVIELLPSLWASYREVTVDPLVRKVTVNFTGLSPTTALDVDALVKIKDKGWERRKLTNGETTFCRNNPADDVEELWLVLSDHDIDPTHQVTGSYEIRSSKNECGGLVGTITWHDHITGGTDDVTDDLITLNVDLNQVDGQWVDANSSYSWVGSASTDRNPGDDIPNEICREYHNSSTTTGGGAIAASLASSITADVDRAAGLVIIDSFVAGLLKSHTEVGTPHNDGGATDSCVLVSSDAEQGGGDTQDSQGESGRSPSCDPYGLLLDGKLSPDGKTASFDCTTTDRPAGTHEIDTITVTGQLAFTTP